LKKLLCKKLLLSNTLSIMKTWDSASDNFRDRQQSKSVIHSDTQVDWPLIAEVLENFPFIQSDSMPCIKRDDMTDVINPNLVQCNQPYERKGEPNPEIGVCFKATCRDFYNKDSTQTVVSIIIALNGLLDIIETSDWTDNCCGHNSDAQEIIDSIDFGFLLFYTVELTLNFYAHFFWDFWRKTKWNWFDFTVILASWLPAQNLAAIRLLRTLRLTRIIGKCGSFTFIIKTLRRSMTGVAALLALLFGITIIYAILGVGLFGEASDKFEDFFTTFWTLFVTLNGESWPDFAEPLIDEFWYTQLYFGTFIITISILVLNMIIAVFIQKTAEVLNEQRDKMGSKSLKGNPRFEFDILLIPDSVSINNGSVDINLKDVKHCVFMLFDWEKRSIISTLECRNGVNLILTSNGFRSLVRPICEGNLQKVRSLLRTMMGQYKKPT